MQDPPTEFDPSALREAMARRLYRRSIAAGHITVPAVPAMIDEYMKMCDNIFASVGAQQTTDETAQLRTMLETELARAYAASQRSNIVISYHAPFGVGMNYRVQAEWLSVAGDYDTWVASREGPLFGTEADARVSGLAAQAPDPADYRVLDIGAGTGRNALALARRGHPVDAVEITPKFADIIRSSAERESLDVHVIESDAFDTMDGVRSDYQLIVASEVVPEFRTSQELRGVFELAADCLAPGGQLVFNAFLPRAGYVPDSAAVELGQQCHTMIFTRDEVTRAAAELPLRLVADDSVVEYEEAHLPQHVWPPTNWFVGWANGLDVFDVEPGQSPIELRWLVFQKVH
ncbi:bifunctional 2-polyprenyl-6-hydroxyphenol methylase/3-demethylubiquinol 3-O-methyltransferase UbiG [Mycobacterium sp. 1423905.2]|uniref:class I SAM-dependent methyltransferase n=1 Tax=Mycobacterium sp. 1423905.2 TaxID=1856859 RepID=UPI0007FF0A6B|nr:class I SAM-dependent methyltransferase [Mycobacterium sp. 1423905.2]OBJ61673.1 methyltransferase type 12 [Mycobacterium sp. 1423905.2]